MKEVETGGGRDSKNCADLACFLAYGRFRKTEAANITWAEGVAIEQSQGAPK